MDQENDGGTCPTFQPSDEILLDKFEFYLVILF